MVSGCGLMEIASRTIDNLSQGGRPMRSTPRNVNAHIVSGFCALLTLGSAAGLSRDAFSQNYPTKPVRIIVAGTPGASSDIIARLVAAKLSESMGQQFIIENRAGGGGRLGTEIASRAVPDGYTLMLISSAHIAIDAIYKELKYNLVKDFAPISLLGSTPTILIINPSLPVNSVKELIALAKSRKGTLRYASAGSGSSMHLAAEMFRLMTETEYMHVPYTGTTPALTSVMSGETEMGFPPMTTCVALIKAGKLRALGVTNLKRSALIPDLPAIAETVPGYEFVLWQGLVAPANTPAAILAKLNTEVVKAVSSSAIRDQMVAIGNEPLTSSQEGLGTHIKTQLEKLREAARRAGARPEE
jgi:tripartite-type tricarboxylate transporter receptor subunit TctC